MFKVIITCTCIDTGESASITREVEDIQNLWEKEQMSKVHACGTSGNFPDEDVWSTTGTVLLNGGFKYIKTWSQYKMK